MNGLIRSAALGLAMSLVLGHAWAAGPQAQSLKGKVVEVQDAGAYTYLKVKTAEGAERWAAVPKAEMKVGAEVSLEGMIMENFESPTTKKKFDQILFGTLGGAAPMAMGKAMPKAMGKGVDMGMGPGADPHGKTFKKEKVKVDKAQGENAKTVAEVFAEKAALKGKTVIVKGKVMKANSGILGKTWLHLQDGSGSESAKNFDLTVTTKENAKVGDVLSAQGVIKLDHDLGMGYMFPVLLDDAKLIK